MKNGKINPIMSPISIIINILYNLLGKIIYYYHYNFLGNLILIKVLHFTFNCILDSIEEDIMMVNDKEVADIDLCLNKVSHLAYEFKCKSYFVILILCYNI